jgi:hypothetical protein
LFRWTTAVIGLTSKSFFEIKGFIMRMIVPICSLVVLAAFAQQSPQTPNPETNNSAKVQAQQALQRYMAAYAHKSFQDLLAVWPDLNNQKKEAEKIRRHLEDGSISNEQMSLQFLETDPTSEGALVRAERTEQFVKTETTSSIAHGDLNMGNMPVQDPGPAQSEKKKTQKKSDTVWFKLHRSGDSWTIVSITSQKPQ